MAAILSPNARDPPTNVYSCGGTPEPDSYEYVDMGAFEYVP
jgi:hypothetical protein